MDLQAQKEKIKLELDEVEDVNLLRAIDNLLAYGKSKNFDKQINPISKEMFYKRNEESRKAIEQGSLISQEEAKRYFTSKNEG